MALSISSEVELIIIFILSLTTFSIGSGGLYVDPPIFTGICRILPPSK